MSASGHQTARQQLKITCTEERVLHTVKCFLRMKKGCFLRRIGRLWPTLQRCLEEFPLQPVRDIATENMPRDNLLQAHFVIVIRHFCMEKEIPADFIWKLHRSS